MKTFTIYQLNMVIQKRLTLNKADALYLFVDNNLLQPCNPLLLVQTLGQIYQLYKNKDGFLHISYYEYSTFG